MLRYLQKSQNKKTPECIEKKPFILKNLDKTSHPKSTRPSGPNIYLNKISIKSNHANNNLYTLSLKDILSEKYGLIKTSYQFNFMIDLNWLLDQYPKNNDGKLSTEKIVLIQGDNEYARVDYKTYPNVKLLKAYLPLPYGSHHSKMMLLFYENSVKVIIHTANLIPEDWHMKTQMIWISPNFEKKDKPVKSKFQSQLFSYLSAYNINEIKNGLISQLSYYDMCNVDCDLVFSVPGYHKNENIDKYGIGCISKLISTMNVSSIDENDRVLVMQCSSIGTLGKEECSFVYDLSKAFLNSNRPISSQNTSFVYPSVKTVRNSFEGYMGGSCLPYNSRVAEKQPYLKKYFNDWKADLNLRTKACPHVKTYFVYENHSLRIPWFLVTSANVSKAAWGCYQKNKTQICIRSYEIGVLFKASTFHDCSYFLPDYICSENIIDNDITKLTPKIFLPFDIPTIKYMNNDEPFLTDATYSETDSLGNILINGLIENSHK